MNFSNCPAPLTDKNVLSEEDRRAIMTRLAEFRIRVIPYPFASAASIVSDLDASRRERYDAYVGTLVQDLGLDFGDSTFLVRPYLKPGTELVSSQMLGFLSGRLDTGAQDPPRVFRSTRTFWEAVAEFHSGNVDHFHALSNSGPRFSVLRDFEVLGHQLRCRLPELESDGRFSCDDYFVVSVVVISRKGCPIVPRSVSLEYRHGTNGGKYCPSDSFPLEHNGRQYRLFACLSDPTEDGFAPLLRNVEAVTVEFDSPDHAGNVEYIVLGSMFGELVIDRLMYLQNEYGIEMTLVTEHSAQHFRAPATGEKKDRALQQYFESSRCVGALNGTLRDELGDSIISSDADEPVSIGRVLPKQVDRCELRFVVPQAAQSEIGWHPLDVLSPTSTRSGGGVYWARRTRVNVKPALPGKRFDDTKSQHDTFTTRIDVTIDLTDKTPGLFWPLYTHLGGGGRFLAGASEIPDPYFEPATPLLRLQDRIFNISGRATPVERIWLARATTLYDYSLILRNIADHIERPDPNTIKISSWRDDVIQKVLPRSPAQLYGLTFYTDDACGAKVLLDDKEIETLFRNSPDETRCASVTIAESEIRTVVFDRLDPATNLVSEVQIQGGNWRWQAQSVGEPAYGRLESAGRLATLRIPLYGLCAHGAQALSFAIKRDTAVSFGLLFETETGGWFYFGDRTLLPELRVDPTASYDFGTIDAEPTKWRVLAAPFHDLTWDKSARPGGPMPNHALASLLLACVAPRTKGVDVAQLVFLRPRATAISQNSTPRFCVAGRVPDFVWRQSVFLAPTDSPLTEPEFIQTDQRGQFCFSKITPGIYKIWTIKNGIKFVDRRSQFVEVGGNVINLVLERPA